MPHHPDIVFKVAAARHAAGLPRDPAGDLAIAAAFRHDPLSAEPFFLAAMAQGNEADIGRSIRLLEEARRRNPRHRLARLSLLDRYLRAGRVQEAATEITVLARLIPEAADLLVTELARLARDPATRAAAIQSLAGDPLLQRVLERLARDGADPALILRLSAGAPRAASADGPPEWQRYLVLNLVERGQVREAYALWHRFRGGSGAGAPAIVYDPQFQGLPGTPPFNWALREDENGVAERSREGGLMVDYFGRVPVELASQLLMLPPGRYRFQFQAEGNANGQGSRLVWRVVCRSATAPLMEIAIDDVAAAPRRFSGEFIVPSTGCDSQWLRLEGVSAEFPTTQSARISGLRLQGGGTNR